MRQQQKKNEQFNSLVEDKRANVFEWASIFTAPYFQDPKRFTTVDLAQLSGEIHFSARASLRLAIPTATRENIDSLFLNSCIYIASFFCDLAQMNGHNQVVIIRGNYKVTHHWLYDQNTNLSYDPLAKPFNAFKHADDPEYRQSKIYPNSASLLNLGVNMLEAVTPLDFNSARFAKSSKAKRQ